MTRYWKTETRLAQSGPGWCGAAATLTGVGIGRFAYVAILPLLVQQAWFSRTDAGYLGAANLFGYLFGMGLASWLGRQCSGGRMVQAAMLLCALSFFSCGWRGGGLPWFIAWRVIAGACGAILMVQAPVLILPRTPADRRGRAGGLIFSGIGIGIIAAATVVPGLMQHGLTLTWCTLGALCLLLTALSWQYWQALPATPTPPTPAVAGPRPRWPALIVLLLAAYALNAVGYLPHTLFWADFLHAELGRPLAEAGFFWACFGVGAALGPYLTGLAADRLGLGPTLLLAFGLKAIGVALPLFAHGGAALLLSSVLVGFFSPGIVGAVSAYALEIGGAEQHRRHWTGMNVGFSLAQAGVAAIMVAIMSTRQSYSILFSISSVALALSAGCVAAIALLRYRARSGARGAVVA